jgi:hypothetical protein
VLKKFHLNVVPVKTSFDPSCHIKKNNIGYAVSTLEYSRVIGSLMYITNCTRPDIAYAVGRLSRYTSNPNNEH